MRFKAAGRNFDLRWRRIFFWLVVLLIAIGLVAFGRQVFLYYQAINNGQSNPLLEQQLRASISSLEANSVVTPADLARLASPDAPSVGAAKAPLTVVVFVDFGCPYSQVSAQPIRRLSQKYQNQVRFIIRDFPIDDLHPGASSAAIAARCAQEQGRYWPYFDQLFANQGKFEDADLAGYADAVGADAAAFKACFTARTPEHLVLQDMQDALRAGTAGTPTFYFNGVKIEGGLDERLLEYLIKYFLEQKTK
jgi:protein-disulfide isomerase